MWGHIKVDFRDVKRVGLRFAGKWERGKVLERGPALSMALAGNRCAAAHLLRPSRPPWRYLRPLPRLHRQPPSYASPASVSCCLIVFQQTLAVSFDLHLTCTCGPSLSRSTGSSPRMFQPLLAPAAVSCCLLALHQTNVIVSFDLLLTHHMLISSSDKNGTSRSQGHKHLGMPNIQLSSIVT
jgi:hypothetical protein